MADFGLVLPEHDLTPQDFKELARRLGRAAFVPLFLKFYERIVTGEATIEEQRKALADIGRWTGVEEDRKVDPNANLPVFNIIFGAPGTPTLAAEVLTAPEPPALDEEEMQILEGIVHAQPDTGASADAAKPDLAASVPAANAADQQAEPAGSGTPDSQALQRQPKRGRPRLRATAAVPEAVPVPEPAALAQPAEAAPQDLMKWLDDAMDGLQ